MTACSCPAFILCRCSIPPDQWIAASDGAGATERAAALWFALGQFHARYLVAQAAGRRRAIMVPADVTTMIFWALAALLLLSGFRIAKDYERAVVFRLGRYRRTAGPAFITSFPSSIGGGCRSAHDDDRSRPAGGDHQGQCAGQDQRGDLAAHRQSEKAVIEVINVGEAVIQVAVTALRNVIGQHTLDDVLKEQETSRRRCRPRSTRVTEPWGVKVERVQMNAMSIFPN